MAENNYECQNCGYDMSHTDAECKYCGSKNPNYKKSFTSFVNPQQTNSSISTGPKKSKLICGLLQIFLGSFGVGRFYSGHYGIAIAQLLLTVCVCGVGSIWGFIDGICILCSSQFKDATGNPME